MSNPVFTLTADQALVFTLHRQHLAQSADSPLTALRRLTAVQAQYDAGLPLALLARCPGMSREWPQRALFETRELVKTWSLRGTIHIQAAADLALLVRSVGGQQAADFTHFMRTRRGLDDEALRRLNLSVLEALAGGPLSRMELHSAVPALAQIPGAAWGLDVKSLAFSGELVLAGERTFARREQWLPGLDWNPPAEEAAQRELLLRYLAGYGPATAQDFAHWSGLKMPEVRAAFTACVAELLAVKVKSWPGEYFIRSADEPTLQELTADLPTVCLLPKFDPLLMGYRDKTRFIAAADLPRVYRPAAQVEAVVLVRGRAAAVWRFSNQHLKFKMSVSPFQPLDEPAERALCAQAGSLADFLGSTDFELSL